MERWPDGWTDGRTDRWFNDEWMAAVVGLRFVGMGIIKKNIPEMDGKDSWFGLVFSTHVFNVPLLCGVY